MPRTEKAAATAFAVALEFERSTYLRGASGTAHPLGVLVTGPGVPRAHMANMLWVDAARTTADALEAALDAALGHLQHRKAQVVDDRLGAALAAPMRARGYHVARHLVMALTRPRDRDPEPGLAREVDAGTHATVEEASTRAEPHGDDPELVRQLSRARAAIRTATPSRFFVGAAHGEQPAAHATLLAAGGIAQVEDVATLPGHRRRGLARAVCSATVDAAGDDDLVFVVADADDWPKELYAKLGFDPVGAVWAFVRDPA